MIEPVELHCPICHSALAGDGEPPYRPFCSQRCKLVDLHNWLSDAYRIPSELDPTDVSDDDLEN
jgi:uncharacterized protein